MIKYKEKWAYPSKACINITDACNLACHYCFVEQKPHFITLELAKQAVDWLWNNYEIKLKNNWISDKNERPDFNFFGGEPTLLWDEIVVPLTKYTRTKYGARFGINMTSNCTLLTEERVNFLAQNNIGLLTSIDGNKATQDLTRPCQNGDSSFDLVIKNLPYILDIFPHSVFRATVNQENCKNIFENYLWAENLGFHNYFFSPNEREVWSNENLHILNEQVEQIFYYNTLYFLKDTVPPLMSSLIDDGYRNALNILLSNKNDYNFYPSSEHCGIGTTTVSINYEGKIFGCQEQDSREKTNSFFYLGDIFTGIDQNKQYNLIKEYLENTKRICEDETFCKYCKNIKTCSGELCPSTCWDLFHNFQTKTKVICYWKNLFTENALTQIQILLKQNNSTFLNYLTTLNDFKKGRTYHGYK